MLFAYTFQTPSYKRTKNLLKTAKKITKIHSLQLVALITEVEAETSCRNKTKA